MGLLVALREPGHDDLGGTILGALAFVEEWESWALPLAGLALSLPPMPPAPCIVAGQPLWAWSSSALQHNLFMAVFVAIVCFAFMIRRRQRFDAPYFSGLFFLALVSFLASALYGALIYREFLDAGLFYEPRYTQGRLEGPTRFVMFGWWTTVVAVGVYSVLHLINRYGVADRKKRMAAGNGRSELG